MDFLIALPAAIKVGGIFAGILITYRLGASLGFSILCHALALTLISGAGIQGLHYQIESFGAPKNFLLILVILLLLFFTESLKWSGRMERTIAALKDWLQNSRFLLSGLPALVGLLPMPGGALFSAPMIASLDSEERFGAAHKVAINYWFRHIWEYWWPLYPGVILAIRYSNLPIGIFFLIQVPFSLASIAGGYFFMLRQIKKVQGNVSGRAQLNLRAAFSAMGPIALLVSMSILGSSLLPYAGVPASLANLFGMLAGLGLGLSLVFGTSHWSVFRKSIGIFYSKTTWGLMLVVIGVLAFSAALQVPLGTIRAETLVSHMRDEFVNLGIPILLVMVLIPFISGAVTGIAVGFVGASFPLVFALLGEAPSLNMIIAATSLAYASGYLGMMLSPVHICFVVTNEYFKTGLFQSYRYLWGPAAVVALATIVLTGTYYLIF